MSALIVFYVGCSIAYIVVVLDDHHFFNSATQGHVDAYTTTGLITNIACDLVIAGTTIYYLQKGRSDFHRRRTMKAINLLIAYTLSTCILAMVFSIVCLITWFTVNQGLVYALFYFTLVRIYPCSFLSTLNSRATVRRVLQGDNTSSEIHFLGDHTESVATDEFPEGVARTRQSSSRVLIHNPSLPVNHLIEPEDGGDSARVIVTAMRTETGAQGAMGSAS
ncbi:hypothetical protein DAEQUDRAFT_731950 [Daedalea quercina L-15889]|uniref:DUF6534 domain-containing protein n=1 Tax=Daedalea quercina L-15889 TaxID=1314783 RepID=A0A165LXM4_9APHY|nr:hypothetical protein DAEQUDRAFT_731950 [Daedalea quercina L-15889]